MFCVSGCIDLGQSDSCETLSEGRYEFNFSFELPLE